MIKLYKKGELVMETKSSKVEEQFVVVKEESLIPPQSPRQDVGH